MGRKLGAARRPFYLEAMDDTTIVRLPACIAGRSLIWKHLS